MNYTPISLLQPGQEIEQIFLLKNLKRNRSFLELEFIDVTGKIIGIFWNKQSLILKNKFCLIKGDINLFRGNKQIKIKNLQPYNDIPENLTDYLSGPNSSILDHYELILNSIIEEIDDNHYRDILNFSLKHINLIDLLKNSPFGLDGPMANKGGLLIHTVNLLRSLIKIIDLYKENNDIDINRSLAIIGAIFRNLGWASSTDVKGSTIEPKDSFYTITTEMASFRMIDHILLSAENDLKIQFPEEKKQALSNICRDDPITIEGKLIVSIENSINILEIGQYWLGRKSEGNWKNKIFVGHLNA